MNRAVTERALEPYPLPGHYFLPSFLLLASSSQREIYHIPDSDRSSIVNWRARLCQRICFRDRDRSDEFYESD